MRVRDAAGAPASAAGRPMTDGGWAAAVGLETVDLGCWAVERGALTA